MHDLEISIIDDHGFLAEGLASAIAGHSPDIRITGMFTSWTGAAANLHALGDVVLLDVVLKDHIPLNAKVRAIRSSGTQVVAMSSLTDPAVVAQALSAGALSFVPKTTATGTVVSAIREVARGSAFRTPEVENALALLPASISISPREHEVVNLYLGNAGLQIQAIGDELEISPAMVKKHLRSVRLKYRSAGHPCPTRLTLRHQLVADGLLIDAKSPRHPEITR